MQLGDIFRNWEDRLATEGSFCGKEHNLKTSNSIQFEGE